MGSRGKQATGALSPRSREAVRATIAASALRLERAVSMARIGLYLAVLVRFLAVTTAPPLGVAITAVPLAAGILASVYILWRVRTPPSGDRLWVSSVALDSTTVFCALLPNALYPTEQYVGILYDPGLPGILVATFGAGLRLSPRAAAVGTVANTAGLLLLVAADRAVSGARFEASFQVLSLSVIFVASCGTLAVILAATTVRLVRRGAGAALRADQAEQALGVVLADHHDLGSMLASVSVEADRVARAVGRPGARADDELARSVRDLAGDLKQVRAVADEVKAHALGDLSAFGELSPASIVETAMRVAAQARTRFERVAIDLDGLAGTGPVLVVGGPPTLHRVLLNLVVNACEGDGRTAASTVWLSARSDGDLGLVHVVIEDDGVGFPAPSLAGRSRSDKPGGSGIGLAVVKGLVEASGGTVRFENREASGARVTTTLMAASPA